MTAIIENHNGVHIVAKFTTLKGNGTNSCNNSEAERLLPCFCVHMPVGYIPDLVILNNS